MSVVTDESREFRFTKAHFRHLSELVTREIGIQLPDHKERLVYGRLVRRLRELQLSDFEDYIKILEDPSSGEMGEFVNAVTTNVTSFFREPHQWKALRETLLPEIVANKSEKRLRIWSAGCSTGQEPYSIMMCLGEFFDQSWDIRLLATDLDTKVIATAESAVYREEAVENFTQTEKRRWLLRGTGEQSGMVLVRPELRENITFRQLNLLKPWPFDGPFDIIFCRNVMIYFDKELMFNLVARFEQRLRPGGLLLIGHSESLLGGDFHLGAVAKNTYQLPWTNGRAA
ncbi:MAG: protein-glutamate O-methyltransferase CheR [Myxococcales bacterium]|nr:protein-glutamate O-methyltransferase CheR [Myxococcales bacterium]